MSAASAPRSVSTRASVHKEYRLPRTEYATKHSPTYDFPRCPRNLVFVRGCSVIRVSMGVPGVAGQLFHFRMSASRHRSEK